MARKFLIDIGLNDTLENVIRKVNYNFRLISGDAEKQTSLIINDATQAIQTELNNKADVVDLSNVAFSGSYTDLSDRPNLSSVATSGDYDDLLDKPSLAAVATSGDYSDLLNSPNLATVATSGDYNDLSNNPNLAAVATSGDYNDLINAPTPSPGSVVDTAIDTTSTNPVQNMAIANALSSKVDKSGDTMTGSLTLDAVFAHFKSSNIDRDGANPSSDTQGDSRIRLVDSDGEYIGGVYPNRMTDGVQEAALQAANESTDESIYYNTFAVRVAKDGTCSYSVSAPSAFRDAITAMKRNSSTIEEGTSLNTQPIGECWWIHNPANAPLSSGYYMAFRIGSLQIAYRFLSNGGMIDVYARCYMNSTWGAWTKISNRLVTNTTISGIITPASGITITIAEYAECGGVATLRLAFKRTGATTSGSFNIGTVVSEKKPAVLVYGESSSSIINYTQIGTAGGVSAYASSTTSTSTTFYCSFTYVLA